MTGSYILLHWDSHQLSIHLQIGTDNCAVPMADVVATGIIVIMIIKNVLLHFIVYMQS